MLIPVPDVTIPGCAATSLLLVTPNIEVQTESKRHKRDDSHKSNTKSKKLFNNSGFDLFFKKSSKPIKGVSVPVPGIDPLAAGGDSEPPEKSRSSWKQPFENIKIYTERKRSSTSSTAGGAESEATASKVGSNQSTPTKQQKKILSGHKQIDYLLHKLIDFILRDFIDSWFNLVSDNKEFSDVRTRHSIEESVTSFCKR